MDEPHLNTLQMAVVTIIIIEEEHKDLFNYQYNIFLIHCPQLVRAPTLAFVPCTQMPQISHLEEEDTLAPCLISVPLLKNIFHNRTGFRLLSKILVYGCSQEV